MAKNKKHIEKLKAGKKPIFSYPVEVVRPVKDYLVGKLFGLEKRRKELNKEDPFADNTRLLDNAAVDADAAEQVGHMQVSAIRQTMDRSMIQIRKALTQIKIGRYGMCERCGKMIDTDRLMIMPETTICVSCEKKKEK